MSVCQRTHFIQLNATRDDTIGHFIHRDATRSIYVTGHPSFKPIFPYLYVLGQTSVIVMEPDLYVTGHAAQPRLDIFRSVCHWTLFIPRDVTSGVCHRWRQLPSTITMRFHDCHTVVVSRRNCKSVEMRCRYQKRIPVP